MESTCFLHIQFERDNQVGGYVLETAGSQSSPMVTWGGGCTVVSASDLVGQVFPGVCFEEWVLRIRQARLVKGRQCENLPTSPHVPLTCSLKHLGKEISRQNCGAVEVPQKRRGQSLIYAGYK